MLIAHHAALLVENAQQAFQMIARTPLQIGYLHDDAVMRQTFNERVRHTLLYLLAFIIQVTATHIHHRLRQIAQFMP